MSTEKWDTPSPRFNEWWNAHDSLAKNPFEKGTPAFWAWHGWKAALHYDMPRQAALHYDTPKTRDEK